MEQNEPFRQAIEYKRVSWKHLLKASHIFIVSLLILIIKGAIIILVSLTAKV